MNKLILVTIAIVILAQTSSALENLNIYKAVYFDESCGNGTCGSGENQCTCPADCGSCSGDVPGAICRELQCVSSICKQVTKMNCCGNRICESGENYGSCAVDCVPKKIYLEVIEPTQSFFRGEKAIIKVKSLADEGVKLSKAEITAKGFFGEIKLFNDGKHDDGTAYDEIYANTIDINKEIPDGKQEITLNTRFMEIDGEKKLDLIVNPLFSIEVVELEDEYLLGEIIYLKGVIKKREQGIALPLDLNLSINRVKVFEEKINSNENGVYSTNYHTSLIDPVGEWMFELFGQDENNNFVHFEKKINVTEPKKTEYLKIEIASDLNKEFERGHSVELAVNVKDREGNNIEKAKVELISPKKEVVKLNELVEGDYSTAFKLGYDLKTGKNNFKIIAKKEDQNTSFEGSTEFSIQVKKTKIKVEVIEPKELYYAIGDLMPIKVILTYPTEELLVKGKIVATVNKNKIKLEPKRPGEFIGQYVVQEGDVGDHKLIIEVQDAYLNEGFEQKRVIVSGESIPFILQKNALYILIGMIILILVTGFGSIFLRRTYRVNYLQKKKKELTALKEDLHRKYFVEATIGKKEYDTLMEEYGKSLDEVEWELERWGAK